MTPSEFAVRVAEVYPDEWPGDWEGLLRAIESDRDTALESTDAIPREEHDRLLLEAVRRARTRDVTEAVRDAERERDAAIAAAAQDQAEKLERLMAATRRRDLAERMTAAAAEVLRLAHAVEAKRMPAKSYVAAQLRDVASGLTPTEEPCRS